MKKTILLTGATDGIGLETAKMLLEQGHHVLLHGRNPVKLDAVANTLAELSGGGSTESYVADLSNIGDVEALAKAVAAKHQQLDGVINNAGIFRTDNTITQDGLDVRFVVNTLAPYVLTQRLLPLMSASGRVVNLSSAAQAPVNLDALQGKTKLDHMAAYAQSKLAITSWSRSMALKLGDDAPVIVSVNPASMLGSKMVKESFGVAGGDLSIGADILVRAALSDEFADASGKYYDNDARQFADPHHDALDEKKAAELIQTMDQILAGLTSA